MLPTALATELGREPFTPLRLCLSDGRTVDILSPGHCFIASQVLYYFRAKPREVIAEDVHVISLGQIVSIELLVNVQPSNVQPSRA